MAGRPRGAGEISFGDRLHRITGSAMTNRFEPSQRAISAILASGFPFQTAIARIVDLAPNCKLVDEEFPWRDANGDDRFLDIVVTKQRFVITIECKKSQKEILTFLQPDSADVDATRVRCLHLASLQDSTNRMAVFCDEWTLTPKSSEARFCVVSTSVSGKDQRMLERDVQLLVRGTDAYARLMNSDLMWRRPNEPNRPVIPVLVTNADLLVARYDSSDVSLETGQLPSERPATWSRVPWIRFRKAFSSDGTDVGERTVIVVRAAALAEWLGKLDAGSWKPTTSSTRAYFR
jgi:hypothetical protein